MVVRGWGSSVAVAIGAAAATSAAQLGLGYGMDVISWAAATGERGPQAWASGLAWAVWVAATATIAGTIVAGRLESRPDRDAAGVRAVLGRLVLAVAAALGAAATVVLVAVPARAVEVADTANPQTVAAGYAMLGVLAGVPLAVAALTARAVAINLLATAGWVWLLAVVAVSDGVLRGQDWTRVSLGFWDLPASGPWLRNILLPDAAVAVAAALLVGAVSAWLAARRGGRPVGVACCGASGPLLIALGYLLAQPDLASVAALDLSRQLVAPYLVVAGLLGSLLVAVRPVAGADEPALTGPGATAGGMGAGGDEPGAQPPDAAATGTSGAVAGGAGPDGGSAGGRSVPKPRRRRQSASEAVA